MLCDIFRHQKSNKIHSPTIFTFSCYYQGKLQPVIDQDGIEELFQGVVT